MKKIFYKIVLPFSPIAIFFCIAFYCAQGNTFYEPTLFLISCVGMMLALWHFGAQWEKIYVLRKTSKAYEDICNTVIPSMMEDLPKDYNEVPHTKIPKADKQNELLTTLIKIGHEDKPVVAMLREPLKEVTELLAVMTEVEMVNVLNHIVREVKHKKEL